MWGLIFRAWLSFLYTKLHTLIMLKPPNFNLNTLPFSVEITLYQDCGLKLIS